MTLRRLLFVLPLCLFVPVRGVPAATVLDEVTVRVYDTARLDAATRAAALRLAAATLAPASVHIRWRECMQGAAAMCETAPRAGELVLRIVRSTDALPSRKPGGGHLKSSIALPLGDAFVDLATQSGVLATIYLDRVTLLARAAGVQTAALLGYAIAHEIGHLLLASTAHSTHGLMRPNWSSDELRRGRVADWTFTEREVAAIRARLEAARTETHVRWGTR